MYGNGATCSIPDWHKLFLAFRFRFFLSYSSFWFGFVVFCLVLSCSLLEMGLEPFDPAAQPLGGEGDSCVEHTRLVWCSTAVESPVLGTVSPRDKFCPRESGTPQSGLLETQQGSSK